jgi:hypothetical protein
MQVADHTSDRKPRFKFEKLEERIAPSACYTPPRPCHDPNPCHRPCGDGLSLNVSLKLNVRLGC